MRSEGKRLVGLCLKSGRVLEVGDECLRIEHIEGGWQVILHEQANPGRLGEKEEHGIITFRRAGIVLFDDVEMEILEWEEMQ